MRKALVLGILAMAMAGAAFGQSGIDRYRLILQLRSSDWEDRAEAARKLISDEEALRDEEVRQALIDLLDRENKVVEETLRESDGLEGVSVKYGEAYSEYYSELLRAVDKIADLSDSRVLKILVWSAYSPDSPFAMGLMGHGEAIIPILIEMAASDFDLTRAHAIEMLGEVLRLARGRVITISPGAYVEAKRVVEVGVGDVKPYVRMAAVEALGKVGDKDAIRILERVAKKDPYKVFVWGKEEFPVREAAIEAIKKLRGEG